MTAGTGGVLLAAVTAFLVGLRHATDPDHLAAVSTLVLDRRDRGIRETGSLGLAWGMGHAATLLAFGLPVVLLGHRLPDVLHLAAEAAVGVLIVALAARLLLRWRRGRFHAHRHAHGGVVHTHPHFHEEGEHGHGGTLAHRHRHGEALGRSPLATFGVGLVHGVGGSAGAVVLVLAAAPDPTVAAVALVVFAGAAALAMGAVSTVVGFALTRPSAGDGFRRAIPLVGAASLAFGVWYLTEAVRAFGV